MPKSRFEWSEFIKLIAANAEIVRLRGVLRDSSESPCSMVNDSESIRFSFNQVTNLAGRSILPPT